MVLIVAKRFLSLFALTIISLALLVVFERTEDTVLQSLCLGGIAVGIVGGSVMSASITRNIVENELPSTLSEFEGMFQAQGIKVRAAAKASVLAGFVATYAAVLIGFTLLAERSLPIWDVWLVSLGASLVVAVPVGYKFYLSEIRQVR